INLSKDESKASLENINTIKDNILETNDNNSSSNALQFNLDELIKLIKQPRQTNEEVQTRDSKNIKISHSTMDLSNESSEKIEHIFISDIKIEGSYQENKFFPRELKDCPECDDGAQEWTPRNVTLKHRVTIE